MENKVDKEAIDMTAQEWFEKGSMFTLDFLLPEERETIYKIMDLYAHGKVRFHAASLLKENEELNDLIDENRKEYDQAVDKITQLQSSNEELKKEIDKLERTISLMERRHIDPEAY